MAASDNLYHFLVLKVCSYHFLKAAAFVDVVDVVEVVDIVDVHVNAFDTNNEMERAV